eukprot:s633_g14.t1
MHRCSKQQLNTGGPMPQKPRWKFEDLLGWFSLGASDQFVRTGAVVCRFSFPLIQASRLCKSSAHGLSFDGCEPPSVLGCCYAGSYVVVPNPRVLSLACEETSERRRLEAELQKSQQESRELSNRLAAAEAQVSGKAAALQAAQSESAKSKERCEEPAARATAAESAVSEMRQQLRQLQEERGKCQEHCEELANRLKAEASKQAQVEVQRPGEGRSWQAVPTAEARNEAEAQEKAVLQERCEQLRQQLAKAEAERSGMLGQMQVLWEERGMYKERIRQLEHQLGEAQNQKQAPASHQSSGARSGHAPHCEAPVDEASSSQERDLAEQLGYSLVDDDGTSSSVLSCSSWDLKKGSQVVAGDDATILEVAKTPEICDASEVVELQAGAAILRVTPDHLVKVADPKGEAEESLYLAAGQLKAGDLVVLDSGEAAALSSVVLRREACQVLKVVFEPDLPVAVFSRPTCILSLGHKRKPPIREPGRPGGPLQGLEEAVASEPGACRRLAEACVPLADGEKKPRGRASARP